MVSPRFQHVKGHGTFNRLGSRIIWARNNPAGPMSISRRVTRQRGPAPKYTEETTYPNAKLLSKGVNLEPMCWTCMRFPLVQLIRPGHREFSQHGYG